MRIVTALLVARGNPREPVPFQEILPLKLKPAVSGKGGSISEVSCVYEMSVLFACFKVNEFDQALCSKEIDSFQKCFYNSLSTKKVRKEREAKGILTPGERKMSPKQINTLLRKYPNIR